MLNWREGFPTKILQRGRECLKNRAVWGLNRGSEGWEAIVVGTEMYPVEISLGKDGITGAWCACPFAQKGQRCKHMAAVLYTMEQLWPEILQDRDDRLVKKLDDYSSNEIDLALKLSIDIFSIRCTAVLLNRSRGEERFSPDEFTLDDLPEDYDGNQKQEQQGDNEPLLFLYPDASAEKREAIRKQYGLKPVTHPDSGSESAS